MRFLSIDLMRTLAIFLMVCVHFVENLSGQENDSWLPDGLAAPLFTFLTGVSYRIWLDSQIARGAEDPEILKRTIRRGLFLIGVGFAFNIVVWLPEDTFNWDVLTFIGAAWLFLGFTRKLPEAVLLPVCVAAWFISPALRAAADYSSYWQNGYFDPDLTLSDAVLGFLVTGYFPFLPWIVYPVAGFCVGRRVLSPPEKSRGAIANLARAGFALVATAIVCLLLRDQMPTRVQEKILIGWKMFPPSPEYVVGTLGFALLSLAGGRQWLDQKRGGAGMGILSDVCSTFSRHAFTMYLLHHIVHLWPLWLYGVARGQEPTHYWQLAMPAYVSATAAVLFLFGAYFLLRWMDRTGRPGMETLMRWLCD